MPELDNYSGPFNPDLKWEDFSKEFLIKLMRSWSYAWLKMTDCWYEALKAECGVDIANKVELAAWKVIPISFNRRNADLAKIELNTVVDSLRVLQLAPDNLIGNWPGSPRLYEIDWDIKNPNYVICTFRKCRTLQTLEEHFPDRIPVICHTLEKVAFERYLVNPYIKVTALKLPPREIPEDICCQWEFKMTDEKQW